MCIELNRARLWKPLKRDLKCISTLCYKNYSASELGELYSIGGIGPSPKNIPLTEETKTIVLKALASLFLLPYPNTTQADQKWPERTELFTSLVKSQSARFDFISSCCFLVYSESVACRKSCSAGIRNIVFDCVPHINTFNVDIKETKAAMNLTTDYFNCMKQEATKDMELTRRTVQACYEVCFFINLVCLNWMVVCLKWI